jgi:hypothetical protein
MGYALANKWLVYYGSASVLITFSAFDLAVDEPLPDLAESPHVQGCVPAHFEGPPIGDHNGMSHTPHEAAVGYGCRVPL